MNKILLNGSEFQCTVDDLPVLIHGGDKAGASLFTISLVANLFSQGSKVLFLSGYPMAREEFFKQVSSFQYEENQVIFCVQEETESFTNYINTLNDINERIIVVKNIELFDETIFDLVSEKQKLVISGDASKSLYKDKILNINFKTRILFSALENIETPELEKYQGFLISDKIAGIVTTQIA